MSRTLSQWIFFLWCLWVPTSLFAVGFGEVKLYSYLEEPLEAEIELIDTAAMDISKLSIALASKQDFKQAALEFPSFLSKLRFEIIQKDSRPYVKISTEEPITSSYLEILLELNYLGNRAIHGYTLLLDPLPPGIPPYLERLERYKLSAGAPTKDVSSGVSVLNEPTGNESNQNNVSDKNSEQNLIRKSNFGKKAVSEEPVIYPMTIASTVTPKDAQTSRIDNSMQGNASDTLPEKGSSKSPFLVLAFGITGIVFIIVLMKLFFKREEKEPPVFHEPVFIAPPLTTLNEKAKEFNLNSSNIHSKVETNARPNTEFNIQPSNQDSIQATIFSKTNLPFKEQIDELQKNEVEVDEFKEVHKYDAVEEDEFKERLQDKFKERLQDTFKAGMEIFSQTVANEKTAMLSESKNKNLQSGESAEPSLTNITPSVSLEQNLINVIQEQTILNSKTEMALKIQLASRYIDIQDKTQAMSLLEEVVASGNAVEKEFAQRLLLNLH